MSEFPTRVLLVEDNEGDARLVQAALAGQAAGEFAVTWVGRLADALKGIGADRFDAALCDLGLPDSGGIATAQAIAGQFPALPLVVLTGFHDEDLGRAAIRHGAQDYLVKGEADGALIARTLRYAIERKRLEAGLRAANEALERRVTERTVALSRQKNLYVMLSQANQTILRASGREELFSAVTRIAVEHGGFRFAWVGLIDHHDRQLKLVARHGEDRGYLSQLRVSIDQPGAPAASVTGQALLAGQHGVSNDFLDDPMTAPWHDAARRAGVRSFAVFPIRQGGGLIGAISVYADEPGFFTADLLATLDEMALDVSFALDNFEREAERKHAEALLRDSEERLRAIFEGALDGILVADAETERFMTGNPAVCRMLGYSPDEIVRLSVRDIHSPPDLPRVMQEFGRQLRGESELAVDVPVMRGDGSVFYADIRTARIRLGGKGALLGMFRDVSERKRAEESLRAAAEQFRGLVEQSIAGIFIIQDRKFAYVNPRFCEIHGFHSEHELIGTDPLSLVVEKDLAATAEITRRLLDEGAGRITHNLTARRRDGSIVEVGVNSARASYRGRPAIIGMMQDISEKKRAEEQIRRYVAQLETAFMHTVEVATTLSEMRDPYTAGHERRVAEIAVALGAELGFDAHRQDGLRVAGYLHDIGKITIPSEILSKPGKLTAAEFDLIKGHPQASHDVLKNVEFPWPVAEVVVQHHERLDGSGYPRGLQGEAILLEARILAVADVVEAMSSHRPYRPGLGVDMALAEVARGRGKLYDANVVDACLKLFRETGYVIPV